MSRRLRLLLVLLAPIALANCHSLNSAAIQRPTPPPNDDIDVSGDRTESFELDGISTVVLRCYCPRRNIRQEPMEPNLILRAQGRLRSQGYIGTQETDPTEALQGSLAFSSRREGDVLYLENPGQWQHMHHSMAISEVWLTLPADRQLKIEPIGLGE